MGDGFTYDRGDENCYREGMCLVIIHFSYRERFYKSLG